MLAMTRALYVKILSSLLVVILPVTLLAADRPAAMLYSHGKADSRELLLENMKSSASVEIRGYDQYAFCAFARQAWSSVSRLFLGG